MADIRAIALRDAGADDHIHLGYEDRLIRRKRLVTAGGRPIIVDLAQTVSLTPGIVLVLEDGGGVQVRAAAETLLEVRGDLSRLAWHIGNRHTPCQIEDERLLILHDHVLADMLARLGAHVRPVTETFTPEGGAYGHGRTLGHAHGPEDAQRHDHDHLHG